MSVSYLQIVSLGWLFTTISLNIGAILRGSGDTMTPMRYNLFSNLLNVFGNYVLIFGKFGFPAMGVAGAALSTTLCRGVADMLIVGGTSLAVYPAAGLIQYYRGDRLVLINKSPTLYDRRANLIIRDSIGAVLGSVV